MPHLTMARIRAITSTGRERRVRISCGLYTCCLCIHSSAGSSLHGNLFLGLPYSKTTGATFVGTFMSKPAFWFPFVVDHIQYQTRIEPKKLPDLLIACEYPGAAFAHTNGVLTHVSRPLSIFSVLPPPCAYPSVIILGVCGGCSTRKGKKCEQQLVLSTKHVLKPCFRGSNYRLRHPLTLWHRPTTSSVP